MAGPTQARRTRGDAPRDHGRHVRNRVLGTARPRSRLEEVTPRARRARDSLVGDRARRAPMARARPRRRDEAAGRDDHESNKARAGEFRLASDASRILLLLENTRLTPSERTRILAQARIQTASASSTVTT